MEKIIVCVCVCVCVNSTLGWCCHCCKKKETLYFKIDEADQGEVIKKCFNNTWYNKCQNKVLLLQEVKVNGSDVLKVTGSGNKWEITDSKGDVLGNTDCNPYNNEWIIVKVITWDENSKSVGDSFIFYVDDITRIKDNLSSYGVFEGIKCYSIKIIAANTSAVKNMDSMFFNVTSALEKDLKEDTAPGLIGLEKLNVENVVNMSYMFSMAIHKQVTLAQLSEWRFSGGNWVSVTNLFLSTVAGLDFSVLDGWRNTEKRGTSPFLQNTQTTSGNVFVQSGNEKDFKHPSWYGYIKNGKRFYHRSSFLLGVIVVKKIPLSRTIPSSLSSQ